VAGARTGPPSILYASDLSVERKGLDTLLAAVGRLLPTRPELRLVLAGPGDPDWAFARLAADDRDRVRAGTDVVGVGEPDELPRRYAAATLTALPAKEEAFGLVLVESLATGTPVVGCTGSGMTDIVSSSDVGRLVPYHDAAALAVALAETIDVAGQPSTPTACRAAAARFDWDSVVGPAHEAVYAAVSRGRRRPKVDDQ
jgi:phosphatidyl-myo-inositol alpha-mannosyltransferase